MTPWMCGFEFFDKDERPIRNAVQLVAGAFILVAGTPIRLYHVYA